MLRRLLLTLAVVAAAAVGAGWWVWVRESTQAAERPEIPFAPLVDESLKDPARFCDGEDRLFNRR